MTESEPGDPVTWAPIGTDDPTALYSPGALTSGEHVLMLSGQVGRAADGTIPSEPREQAAIAFDHIDRLLGLAGCSWSDVAFVRAFAVTPEAWEAVREVREGYLARPRPASTMVYVSGLVDPRLLLEVEVVAVR